MKMYEKIKYNEITMVGKTQKDQEAISNALHRGRKLHIEIVDDDLRVIDICCYIATAVYRKTR